MTQHFWLTRSQSKKDTPIFTCIPIYQNLTDPSAGLLINHLTRDPCTAGVPLSDDDVTAQHYTRVQQLQRLLFKHHPQLRDLALANCGAVGKRRALQAALEGLGEEVLRHLVTKQLRLVHVQMCKQKLRCVLAGMQWPRCEKCQSKKCVGTILGMEGRCCRLLLALCGSVLPDYS